MPDIELKTLLQKNSPEFWDRLVISNRNAVDFEELFFLSTLRKKARLRGLTGPPKKQEILRLALIGGCSLYPLHEFLEHLLDMESISYEIWLGSFDNYMSEIMDETSGLYQFSPGVVVLFPSEQRCKYKGKLTDPRAQQQEEAAQVVSQLLDLARQVHQGTKAEVVITNFMLPARHDPGALRSRTLGSDWSFLKWVNLELGLSSPSYLHICDLEFLANRHGALHARDDRAWFETKQPCSSSMLVNLSRELIHLILSLRTPPRKVLVLDLDNTLWGGVIADDGMEGIEIGDTSARGEAFKAFQKSILSLKERGVLLAVCSKNDHAKAVEPFEKHPEMLLRMADFVSFKANWEPKSDNLRRMAAELDLGLDSFVFVDDNPAEIEIVRQFVPEMATLLLSPDPAEYVAQLQDCRLFELRGITTEDVQRTTQYRSEAERRELLSSSADMDSYLASLQMEATISEFTPVDSSRLAQLIGRSNQFNLTTRRRTEANVHALMNDPDYVCFSVRLKDRFGDHGLISIVIGQAIGKLMNIDTWLMSCRVLKRQVEDEVLNELVRLARVRGCHKIEGVYLKTPKNEMVRDFYTKMGFSLLRDEEEIRMFVLDIDAFHPLHTKISVVKRAYEPN